MNRVEMQGLFYEVIGQTSAYPRAPGSGTPAGPTLLKLLDESILEMCSRAKPLHLRKMKSWTLAYATADEVLGKYDMPLDFLDYWHVEEPIRIAGRPLVQAFEGQVDSLASDETVSYGNQLTLYWYEAGVKVTAGAGVRQIGFFPIPRSGTAKMPYCRIPTTLSGLAGDSTDYFDLPTRFHRAPVMRAAALFLQNKREKPAENQDPAGWLAYFDQQADALAKETKEALRATFRRVAYDPMAGQVEDWMPV